MPVASSQRAGAIRRLEQTPIVALTRTDAAALTGRPAPAAPLQAFLVRAVSKNEAAGAFDARLCGDRLWVHHGSLGQDIPKSIRVPLVIFLEHRPSGVIVSWSMAR